MTSTQVLVAVVVAAVVALAMVLALRKQHTRTLADRFGPEYDRALETAVERTKAEAELDARTKRVEHLQIRPLTTTEHGRFAGLWRSAQERFVDSPPPAGAEADQLGKGTIPAPRYPLT